MAFPISNLVDRLRSKIDTPIDQKEEISQDGTSYVIVLANKPILSGSDSVYISHSTNTTGFFQYVPRNYTQSALYSSGNNLTYQIDLRRGEFSMFQGSGYVIGSGLNPFAPWNTSILTVYYQSTTYSDLALSNYLSYAVASVEASLQLGMYVSGISGVTPPLVRDPYDLISYKDGTPYAPGEKFVIAEDLEIIQELITKRAMFDVLSRERRIGAGNAIKIVDGDTQIDTSVNQRYLADLLRDTKGDYTDMLKWVMHNMFEGYSLRQIDEFSASWGRNGGVAGTRGAIGMYGTMNNSYPMDGGG